MIQRYNLDHIDTWDDMMVPAEDGVWIEWEYVKPLLEELRNLRKFANNVNEALNSGDGSYRP